MEDLALTSSLREGRVFQVAAPTLMSQGASVVCGLLLPVVSM